MLNELAWFLVTLFSLLPPPLVLSLLSSFTCCRRFIESWSDLEDDDLGDAGKGEEAGDLHADRPIDRASDLGGCP